MKIIVFSACNVEKKIKQHVDRCNYAVSQFFNKTVFF